MTPAQPFGCTGVIYKISFQKKTATAVYITATLVYMKIKSILILLLIAVGVNYAGAAISASAFMKEASALLTSSKSITASFRIESAGQQPVTGEIAVKGDKFAVTTTVSSTIFDGNTQWTISANDREISIFEPTADEIAQINPFAIIKSYERNYNLKVLSSDNSTVRMQLLPKHADSSIKKIIIVFGATSKLPKQMTIALDDGTTLHVTINDIKTNAGIHDSRFVVATKNYPGYEVIDLR